MRIKPGILYQDHPCFAKTESGQHAYLNLTDADMVGIADLNDFPLKGTREVSSADYIYQIKRMAHPKLPCPIFSTMAKYIIGLDVLEQQLAGELKRIRAERKQAGGVLYNQEMDERENPIHLDLDQFDTDGLRVLDKYTYQIILKRKYPQLVYWLAMPFFAPIPNSTV